MRGGVTYEYDIFLSYTRRGGGQTWVRENFYPALRDCLDNAMAYEPKIFVDWEIKVGDEWPDELESALRRSRLLVSVLSPPYFRSHWCLAEWSSFAARQEHLKGQGRNAARALIHPAVYADGDHFPADAQRISRLDFSAWNAPMSSENFRSVPVFRDFYQQVQLFADTLAKKIPLAPEWDPDWPIVRPDPPPEPPAGLPRL
jgi:hypothetical protein